MTDNKNIEERIKKARELKSYLESKLEKVKGTPREDDFKLQVDKLDELISHLERELNQ